MQASSITRPASRALRRLALTAIIALSSLTQAPAAPAPDDGKLRIICFDAHPDDCELQAGGTAAMWAAKGHRVKLISVTNGDIGHRREAGGPLAERRHAEAEDCARRRKSIRSRVATRKTPGRTIASSPISTMTLLTLPPDPRL